jgi:hypothetical protein
MFFQTNYLSSFIIAFVHKLCDGRLKSSYLTFVSKKLSMKVASYLELSQKGLVGVRVYGYGWSPLLQHRGVGELHPSRRYVAWTSHTHH